MTSFRTEIPPLSANADVGHQHGLLSIGSCFAEQIGLRLQSLKFTSLINPFGIIYNPVSIANALELLISTRNYTGGDLFENLGLWHSPDHHGRFSHPDKETALATINQSLTAARQFLQSTDRLILTFGTAHVFIDRRTRSVVANCHKMPGQTFDRRRLSVEETVGPLVVILQKLKALRPNLEVIATVSPVRHLRDGLVENQRSKATLLLGLDAICRELPYVHYFPAYEIVLDDLRDYRFYEQDLAHPNATAVDYIWRHFAGAFFSGQTETLCQRLSQLSDAVAHRPFHPTSDAHQTFLKKQLTNIENLKAAYPTLDFSVERDVFNRQLIKKDS